MSFIDQQQFIDAVRKANEGSFFWLKENLKPAIEALSRLAMFDMLPALNAIGEIDRSNISMLDYQYVGPEGSRRIAWAMWVVVGREIRATDLPQDQVNDGRVFLGCTRLDNAGVQKIIDDSLKRAQLEFGSIPGFAKEACCGAVRYAWTRILVPQRQEPGNSLTSNLAAAAHYMLSRYHVCSAKATAAQMKLVVIGYDVKKRALIAKGDSDLKSMALTGNRPFPPDFAIENWAFSGADDGEKDRLRCNSAASQPIISPTINQSEWGE